MGDILSPEPTRPHLLSGMFAQPQMIQILRRLSWFNLEHPTPPALAHPPLELTNVRRLPRLRSPPAQATSPSGRVHLSPSLTGLFPALSSHRASQVLYLSTISVSEDGLASNYPTVAALPFQARIVQKAVTARTPANPV